MEGGWVGIWVPEGWNKQQIKHINYCNKTSSGDFLSLWVPTCMSFLVYVFQENEIPVTTNRVSLQLERCYWRCQYQLPYLATQKRKILSAMMVTAYKNQSGQTKSAKVGLVCLFSENVFNKVILLFKNKNKSIRYLFIFIFNIILYVYSHLGCLLIIWI